MSVNKNKFYKYYTSTHTDNVYGKISIKEIEKQFCFFESYWGKFLPKDKKSKILDLGCGDGSFVHWLNSKGYQNVEGMDISEEQINRAASLNLKNIYQGDVLICLNNYKEKFDLIIARDLIEHLNKRQLLDLMGAVEKQINQNGIFMLQTVNAENVMAGRLRYGDFTHELAFTTSSIK